MDIEEKNRCAKSAEQFIAQGRFEEAIRIYEDLIRQNPGEDSFVLQLAWAYKDSGRTDDAVRNFEILFDKELQRKLFTGFGFDELVRIFRENGRYDRLVEISERAVAVQPEDISLLTTLGDSYLKAERFHDAIRVFRRIITMEPDASAVLLRLGNALIACGDFEGARAEYEKAAQIDETAAPSYWGRLGMALMAAGQYQRAEEAFRKAVERVPADALYYCDLGDTLIYLGRIEEAEQAYCQAVSNRPYSAGDFYNRLGNTLARENQHEWAVRAFHLAIEKDPSNPFYYVHLSRSYASLGCEDLARRAYEKATTLGEAS